MNKINDGGPAFPVWELNGQGKPEMTGFGMYRGMSDVMMFGIAKMPYELAMSDELSRRQFYANTQRLAAALEAAREDAERWRALREMDGGEIYALLGDCDGIHPEQADAAIDQARGKAGQEVGNG